MKSQKLNRLFGLILAMLLMGTLIACTTSEPAATDAPTSTPAVEIDENLLADTDWILESLDGVEVKEDMTLIFSADTLSGSDGCNTFTASYTVEDGRLIIADNMAVTAMACPDIDGEMARQYLDALLSADTFVLNNDVLTIETANGSLVFGVDSEDDTAADSDIGLMVNPLVTTNWMLTEINGVTAAENLTLQFGPDTISGSDGCNTFSGTYIIDREVITIAENLASTMMACPDIDPNVAQQYLNALVGTAIYTFTDDTLTLQTENDELVFAPMMDTELNGTHWQLDSLVSSDSNITQLPVDTDLFIIFENEAVSGSGGCNSFSGEVTVNAPQMSFDNIAATLMACADDGVAQRESEFFTMLEKVVTYEIVGDMLTLYDEDGVMLATFVGKDELNDAPQAADLLNIVWQWVRFEDTADNNSINVNNPADYTIQFMDDGNYALQVDCNSGNDSYIVDGSSLTINPGALTQAACDEGSLEGDFVSKLGEVTTFVFDNDGNLILNLNLDSGNMVFTAAN